MTVSAKTDFTKTAEPLILEIKGNSLDDGPGVRSVVFIKGCPLNCVWCHNPESKKVSVEIAFDPGDCIGCNTCIGVCAQKALSRDDDHFIDRAKCTLCFDCVESCPAASLSRVGKQLTVDEITEQVLKDKPFYDTSGGGVTLSGGEPSMFMDFASALLKKLKKQKIHTLIETSGFFDYDEFTKKIMPYLDEIYFDIKLFAEEDHKRYAGVSNKRILENFAKLNTDPAMKKISLLPRVPLIPGITDTDFNLQGIAEFLSQQKIKKAALMRYNPLWHEKVEKIGGTNSYTADSSMSSWMDSAQFEHCREIFLRAEIEV